MTRNLKIQSEEISLETLRKRRMGIFDSLERDGDYKVIMPSTESFLPSFEIKMFGASEVKVESGFRYRFPEVALTRLANAIVGKTGAVFIGGHAISETLEGLLEENVPICDNISTTIEAVVSGSRYGNFNHAVFSCETLPLLYLASMDQCTSNLPTMLHFDQRFCTKEYEVDHRQLINYLGVDARWIDEPLAAEVVFVPTVSRRRGASRASLLTRFISQLARRTISQELNHIEAEMIYVSRRFANSRVPSNIDEIEELARRFGFGVVHLEKMSCLRQIEIFRSARFVLAEHGAGLINLMYCQPGTRVMEIFPSAMFGHWTFRLISYVSGLDYSGGVFPVCKPWLFNRDPVKLELGFFSECLEHLLAR